MELGEGEHQNDMALTYGDSMFASHCVGSKGDLFADAKEWPLSLLDVTSLFLVGELEPGLTLYYHTWSLSPNHTK